jgi:hypothetical protein
MGARRGSQTSCRRWKVKPTLEEVMEQAQALGELVPFFPRGEAAQRVIVSEIQGFCGTSQELRWFIHEFVRKVPKYEGVPQLRAVFCSRFKPADGIEPTIDVPGFTAEDAEARHQRQEAEETDRRLAEYKNRALKAGVTEELSPLDIAAISEGKKL